MAQSQSAIKFLHFRQVQRTGKTKTAKREISPRGGLTVAYTDDPISNQRYYALAQCSREDNFHKARGRELAANRLSGVFAQVAVTQDDQEFASQMEQIAARLHLERAFSRKRKARKASKRA
jgi:hypothetical protein